MKNRTTLIAVILLVIVLGVVRLLLRSSPKVILASSQQVAADSPTAIASPNPSAGPPTAGELVKPQASPASQVVAAKPAPPSPTAALSRIEQDHLKVLDEVLKSRNDNDRRLDTDFRNLTEQMKSALRDKYANAPNENRNERGTVAFLLGREIKSSDDVAFLASILNEPACQSLQACAHRPSTAPDEHASMANEVTLVYPQLVAIKSLERYLTQSAPDDPARKAAIDALTFAERSPQSKIASAAQQALASHHL